MPDVPGQPVAPPTAPAAPTPSPVMEPRTFGSHLWSSVKDLGTPSNWWEKAKEIGIGAKELVSPSVNENYLKPSGGHDPQYLQWLSQNTKDPAQAARFARLAGIWQGHENSAYETSGNVQTSLADAVGNYGTAREMTKVIPFVGAVPAGRDAGADFYHGRVGSGLGNTLSAALSLAPGASFLSGGLKAAKGLSVARQFGRGVGAMLNNNPAMPYYGSYSGGRAAVGGLGVNLAEMGQAARTAGKGFYDSGKALVSGYPGFASKNLIHGFKGINDLGNHALSAAGSAAATGLNKIPLAGKPLAWGARSFANNPLTQQTVPLALMGGSASLSRWAPDSPIAPALESASQMFNTAMGVTQGLPNVFKRQAPGKSENPLTVGGTVVNMLTPSNPLLMYGAAEKNLENDYRGAITSSMPYGWIHPNQDPRNQRLQNAGNRDQLARQMPGGNTPEGYLRNRQIILQRLFQGNPG